VKQKSG